MHISHGESSIMKPIRQEPKVYHLPYYIDKSGTIHLSTARRQAAEQR